MRVTNYLSIVVLSALSSALTAQESEKPLKWLKAQEIQIQTGGYLERTLLGSVEDFKKLAPNSELLKNDLTGYNQDWYAYYYSNPMFSILVGFQFNDRQKEKPRPNPLLRLGISYFSGYPLANSFSKETSGFYDTLTSSQTGKTYVIDSVNREYFSVDYFTNYLRFDGSLIYRTNPEARFSFFTGAGLTAGISFNSETYIYHSNYTWLSAQSSGDLYYPAGRYTQSGGYSSEHFPNKSHFGFSGYIPLGMDFRLGKKHPFWSNIHLFYELRLGLNVNFIPDLKTVANTNIHNGFGLKFTW
jgi:hypothetical protein